MFVPVRRPGIAPAPALLAPWFADVTLLRYDDGLVVKEVEPLVAVVAAWWARWRRSARRWVRGGAARVRVAGAAAESHRLIRG